MTLRERAAQFLGVRQVETVRAARSGPMIVKRPADRVVLRKGEPDIEVHRDCLYVPMTRSWWEDPHWGLYDQTGRPIEAADFRSAPGPVRAPSPAGAAGARDAPYAPGDRHFYVGAIIPQYGHFLCSSLARLWALDRHDVGAMALVGHGEGPPRQWFSQPYIRGLLGAAGVAESDFADFQGPVLIRELIVAQPSFQERHFAYRAHAKVAHRWGDRLAKTQDLSETKDIVYVSKTWDDPNPRGLTNEAAVVMALQDLGVPIVYPELLPIAEQVALFRTTRTILGQVGSAFHTAILSTPRSDQALIQVTPSPRVYSSNHALIDMVNGKRSHYLYFDGTWVERPQADPGFQLTDPHAVARELLAYAHSL